MMNPPIILSTYTVKPLLQAMEKRQRYFSLSPDLGLSTIQVILEGNFIVLPDQRRITKQVIQHIFEDTQSCFIVGEDEFEKIAFYSDLTDRYYSLYPTSSAPTMLLSGIPMHRIKDTDPFSDTMTKIKAAQPAGLVLDTTTGLGYTAIAAARTARLVITIELDPTVIRLCQMNPWSKDLFNNPRISKIIGDSFDMIQTFPDKAFSRVVHDPPTFSLAGDLYSGEFYKQVFRTLKQGGRFFHYIGDLNSQSGRKVSKGVTARLQSAGFRKITFRPEAFALLAYKD